MYVDPTPPLDQIKCVSCHDAAKDTQGFFKHTTRSKSFLSDFKDPLKCLEMHSFV